MFHSRTEVLYGNNGLCLCSSAQQPECVGGGVPVTAEEMREVMYKPQTGEWGERSRDDECERIIAGIDQLITVGKNTLTSPLHFDSTSFSTDSALYTIPRWASEVLNFKFTLLLFFSSSH